MIHHLSIAAEQPQHVAGVLADLLDGIAIPFPPHPGAWMAVARDAHGTAVEVYPVGSTLRPNGLVGTAFVASDSTAAPGPVHFALSVDRSVSDIEELARGEGWQCYVCSRGGDFDVVELWIENNFLVELLPPQFASRYLAFAAQFNTPENAALLMAGHERAAVGAQ